MQLLMVVSIVLERNPELEFQEQVDLDRLVKDAFADFQKDRSRREGSEKQVRADLWVRTRQTNTNLFNTKKELQATVNSCSAPACKGDNCISRYSRLYSSF